MDVSGLLGALTGSGNVKIDIVLNNPGNNSGVVPLSHYPSWKLHKNPFWRVRHSLGTRHQRSNPISDGSLSTPSGTAHADSIIQDYQTPQPSQPPRLQRHLPHSHGHQQPVTHIHSHGEESPAKNPPDLIPDAGRQACFAFEATQDVGGSVRFRIPSGKKIEHLGIRIVFIGRIDMSCGLYEGRPHYDFISLSKELAPPGVFYGMHTDFPFLFKNMDKEHESYKGRNVAVRYFVKVVLERKFLPPILKEQDVWVQKVGQEPTENEAIKMEVGIEDCLHIEFEYERRVFHLQDTIVGRIHFMLVRIKIKHMELAVIRRETSGESVASTVSDTSRGDMATSANSLDVANVCTETQTLVKYEIMDGAPVKGEIIPVKLCLEGVPSDLCPTYKVVNSRFSVRYFLNLVLVDAEDRRYFKQQEIILWRHRLG